MWYRVRIVVETRMKDRDASFIFLFCRRKGGWTGQGQGCECRAYTKTQDQMKDFQYKRRMRCQDIEAILNILNRSNIGEARKNNIYSLQFGREESSDMISCSFCLE